MMFIQDWINYKISLSITSVSSSDHTPIYLEVGAWATKQIKPSLTSGRINWPKFKKLVTVNINLKPSLKTTSEIDSAILSLTSTIQNSASAASSNHPPPRNNTNIPAHIVLLLADKRRARTQWHRSKYPSDKATFNYLKNKLNKAILKLKNENYQNYIQNLSNKDLSLWKATKKLIHHKLPPPPHSVCQTIRGPPLTPIKPAFSLNT
jgi:hypothetical protein